MTNGAAALADHQSSDEQLGPEPGPEPALDREHGNEPVLDHEHGNELSALERDVLGFEAAHPRHSPAKEDAIRRRFDRSSAQYYQILATLIETPAALAHDPLVISRLRRIRDARIAERDERRAQRRSSAASGRTKAR